MRCPKIESEKNTLHWHVNLSQKLTQSAESIRYIKFIFGFLTCNLNAIRSLIRLKYILLANICSFTFLSPSVYPASVNTDSWVKEDKMHVNLNPNNIHTMFIVHSFFFIVFSSRNIGRHCKSMCFYNLIWLLLHLTSVYQIQRRISMLFVDRTKSTNKEKTF